MGAIAPATARSPKDYATDQEVRWCPGCGDYAILKAMQRVLADLNAPQENTVFISGIGCSSRFPYYMATYGFHTIHGRAPAVATGVKLTNPDLDVWVASGDGDSLSIGGNHLMHLLRRNVDLQFLLFNNEIYGLTKGQYSPTSRIGTRSPSSPQGSSERPVSAAIFALGAGARFVARGIDTDKLLPDVLKAAHAHIGTSFVEIFQNCLVYNDEVFANFTAREVADDRQIHVEHGKPLRFGAKQSRGLRLKPGTLTLEAVTIGENGIGEDDILVHDATDRVLAGMLAAMESPTMPVALGVIYNNPAPAFAARGTGRSRRADDGALATRLNAALRRGDTWSVNDRPGMTPVQSTTT